MLNKWLKNLFDLAIILLLVIAITSCASGGGSSALVQEQVTPPTPTTPVQPFQTIDPFQYTYDTMHGDITVTYGSGSYLDDSNFAKTDKYKIADYGFFQITTQGRHDGTSRNPQEIQDAGPFLNAGIIHRADLNGDGHQDFYYEGFFEGDRDDMPRSYLHAFLNDGSGHFVYSPELFAGGSSPCINYGDLDFKTDAQHECGMVRHLQRSLVADFNGDGIDDFMKPSILHLSNNGVIESKGQTNLPSWMFAEHGAYSHDIVAGDLDNDGDLDIFGAWTHNEFATNHTMGAIINDGTGNFTDTNWNFYKMPSASDIGADHVLWNTTAAIGDFDNDGHVDVSVGWANPSEAGVYGFAETHDNSAGAVFWNDGNMDWSKLWSELPSNYFGANGIANDMETMDINGDGYLDIILASTKVDPYYNGRVIQLFLNNGNGTFTDVSEQYGSITKYKDGTGDWWNGEGSLHVLDFDNDGDLDIVDSVNSTYVLINNGGSFELYDNFPNQGDCGGCRYYPVEIDGKWQYDFIGYTDERTADSQTSTFFQVLDPPLMQMMNDITTKPAGYVNTIFESKTLLDDLRVSVRSDNVLYNRVEGAEMLGASYGNFFIADFNGDIEGGLIGWDTTTDALHFGYYYADRTIKAQNDTLWYGTGTADVKVKSFTSFAEFNKTLKPNLYASVGYGMTYSRVGGFIEQGSSFNVKVNGFTMLDANIFADITYNIQSTFGATFLTLGLDYHTTLEDTKVKFADSLNYEFNSDLTVGKLMLTHQWNNIYFRLKTDTEDRVTSELGFTINL